MASLAMQNAVYDEQAARAERRATTRERPSFLRGYSGGERVHAVRTLPPERDPNPTGHGHRPDHALCGAWVTVKPVGWTPRLRHACKRCVASFEKETR